MAGLDPRRSSRARATQPQSQGSSTASSVSGRQERPERSSRYLNKAASPQKSNSTGSLSSEPPEDSITAADTFITRRRTRGQGEERDRTAIKVEQIDMANGDDEDVQDEDEAVRCVCGNEEYQGPPPPDEDYKHGHKHYSEIDPIFTTAVTDDTAGLFVQCDICKVWQHGGCVGIMTEESTPDDYFCELCRQDLHKLWTASNGNVYSQYLPMKRQSRHSSRATSLNKDGARSPVKEKEMRGRNSSANHASKRRSTMNSREAGYDEAEALRRAIEASKEESLEHEGVPRRPKRGRSDSEEKQDSMKRQRTSSRSVSPSIDKAADDSDDACITIRSLPPKTKSRSATAARNQREKFEREEKERLRAEAANKRKGRAERRRADGMESTIYVRVPDTHADADSDPSEELPLASRAYANRTAAVAAATMVVNTSDGVTEPPTLESVTVEPLGSQPTPESPPTSAPSSKVEKKKANNKRRGRNQYTKDRDFNDEGSPARSLSRDIQRDEHTPSTSGKMAGESAAKAHHRSRGGVNQKLNMNDMKRRAAALLDFITRTQVELAAETLTGTTTDLAKASSATTSFDHPMEDVNSTSTPIIEVNGASPQRTEFKELGCVEMMDSLTRRLVKWQNEYAT
ncbi:putative histone deacetylase complex subunit cti6 [Podospora fimiseda]|uniref:Histone deacetylase complex subunit cti6 n=1 Tax=Podospora fimiseda TaxID=252190 RepID=A0AAN7BKY4_9PEZI|nr:putative histone deacetylase complex subunit cti6 [Podospora fimiseda]